MKWGALSILALLSLAMGGYGGYRAGYNEARSVYQPAFSYPEGRFHFLAHRAAQFGKADTLIIGDSLIEQTFLENACGRTFEAGIGGARIHDPMQVLPSILQAVDPDRVFVALGTNYFTSGEDQSGLEEDYPQILDLLEGREVGIIGIGASDNGNEFLLALARARGHAFVQPPPGPFIEDGVHYTVEGSRALRETIEQACLGEVARKSINK
ncbi:SGNH/GDSL hydrolase family protein [Qipengyuania sp. CAU 1752]